MEPQNPYDWRVHVRFVPIVGSGTWKSNGQDLPTFFVDEVDAKGAIGKAKEIVDPEHYEQDWEECWIRVGNPWGFAEYHWPSGKITQEIQVDLGGEVPVPPTVVTNVDYAHAVANVMEAILARARKESHRLNPTDLVVTRSDGVTIDGVPAFEWLHSMNMD